MNVNSNASRYLTRALPLTILGGLLLTAVAWAQPRPSDSRPPRPEYDYVGVGGSLVRVEHDSGRVEILEQRDSPGLSLTIPQSKPWSWREIRVDNRPRKPGEQGPRKPGRGEPEDD